MEPGCCFVCMESEPPPIQFGCACRSDTGLIHTGCAIAAAKARAEAKRTEDAWLACATCGEEPTGPMRIALSEARVGWSVQFGSAALARAHMHLARTRIVEGQFNQAEAMLPALRAEARGEGTSSMLTVTAECLKDRGQYAEAEAIYRELVSSLPRSSYESMCTRSNLARLLLDMGLTVESRALQEEVVIAARAHVHPDSPEMLGYESDLALCMLRNFDNRDERPTAERALRGLVARSTRALGPAHPCTLMTQSHHALALHLLDRSAEAVRVQMELMDRSRPDDMHTLKTNLATFLIGTDEWERGIAMGRDALASHRRALGDAHTDTLMCGLNLAWAMAKRGMVVDAEQVVRTVLSFLVSDPTSTSAIGASHCLAVCLTKRGRRAEGTKMMTDLASACRTDLGASHANTIAATRLARTMTMACVADGCFLPGALTCAACQKARYCSVACQRRHWKTHKPTCRHVC